MEDILRYEKLTIEIKDLGEQINNLEMEVFDVLTNVETPESSDVEGEEVDEPEFRGPKQALLEVETLPQRETTYSPRYRCPYYRMRAERKVKLMKEEIKKNSLARVLLDPEFPIILENVQTVYPDDGGRRYINSLVVCHTILKPDD